jgi:hypothetical protein
VKRLIASIVVVVGSLAACATRDPIVAADLEPGRLPVPNATLDITGLGPCTDNPDRRLRIDASQPVHVLVHGCFGSSGQFRGLAQVLAFHGQQAACFTYDDRAKLGDSAGQLRAALRQLAEQTQVPHVTVIGHSQGALIARRSLTDAVAEPLPARPLGLRLVTVSGPFAGIESARPCGRTWLYPATLGLLPLSCYVTTGAKWADITYSSRFIREPGRLASPVLDHLKIDTDERNTCRRKDGERCVESDEIFSLDEQRLALDNEARMKRVLVSAGHVEIVGDKREAPTKLLEVLQAEGVLRVTPPHQTAAFERLLSQVYRSDRQP